MLFGIGSSGTAGTHRFAPGLSEKMIVCFSTQKIIKVVPETKMEG